ncbi:hypothetical protein Q3G72_003820 [Acer saccharum]|nr:hypothetical protein Q3G72_003820 [Acer saccharum]
MDIFHEKHPQKQISKKRLNHEQVMLLERSFTTHKKLEPELKLKLANQLGVPPRQVAIWYQNKRARWRTQSLEVEYSTVQVKLENALADKRRLERDVKQLREELRKAHEMLFGNMKKNQNNINGAVFDSNCSSDFSDQRGSSGLHDHDHDHQHNHHQEDIDDEVLQQFDHELYACLIGAGGSAWG